MRAAVAAAFGAMYVDGAENMPALNEVMQQVKNWEIARPGFAGAFLGQLLMNRVCSWHLASHYRFLHPRVSDVAMFNLKSVKMSRFFLFSIQKNMKIGLMQPRSIRENLL